MKKNIFIFVILFTYSYVYSQRETIRLNNKNTILVIDFNNKCFSIKDINTKSNDNSNSINIQEKIYNKGTIKTIKERIIGYVQNKKYFILFSKQLYVYSVIKGCAYFKQGVNLYVHSYDSKKQYLIIRHMSWINGMRNGNWTFIDYKNKKEYVIKYLNGEKMDSVPFDNLKYNSVPFEYNF